MLLRSKSCSFSNLTQLICFLTSNIPSNQLQISLLTSPHISLRREIQSCKNSLIFPASPIPAFLPIGSAFLLVPVGEMFLFPPKVNRVLRIPSGYTSLGFPPLSPELVVSLLIPLSTQTRSRSPTSATFLGPNHLSHLLLLHITAKLANTAVQYSSPAWFRFQVSLCPR